MNIEFLKKTLFYMESLKKSLKTPKYTFPLFFYQNWKHCESKKERIILRICKLIACNLVKKALYLMKVNNIDINTIFISKFDDFDESLTQKNIFKINFCLNPYNLDSPCLNTFLEVACVFSSFKTIESLCKAGSNPFLYIDDSDFVPLFENNPVIIIPKILKIFCKFKSSQSVKNFFYASILNISETLTSKGRFGLINTLIQIDSSVNSLLGDKSSYISPNFYQKLFMNKGITKGLIQTKNLNNLDFFYLSLCHKFKIVNTNVF